MTLKDVGILRPKFKIGDVVVCKEKRLGNWEKGDVKKVKDIDVFHGGVWIDIDDDQGCVWLESNFRLAKEEDKAKWENDQMVKKFKEIEKRNKWIKEHPEDPYGEEVWESYKHNHFEKGDRVVYIYNGNDNDLSLGYCPELYGYEGTVQWAGSRINMVVVKFDKKLIGILSSAYQSEENNLIVPNFAIDLTEEEKERKEKSRVITPEDPYGEEIWEN